MKPILLALTAALSACGGLRHSSDCIEGEVTVVVRSISERPPPSGVLASFLEIEVTTVPDQVKRKLYIAYLGEVNQLPPRGATCVAKSECREFGLINVNSGLDDGSRKWRSRLSSMICDGVEFVPDKAR